jgi:CheY-specific phosphatase CheX
MHEIVIAIPRLINSAISRTGIAQNISHENGSPMSDLKIKKTARVGVNLNIATTVAEIGNIIRGKAVFIISLWPEVIDLTPPLKLLLIM